MINVCIIERMVVSSVARHANCKLQNFNVKSSVK